MAEFRFQPHADFEFVVTKAAMGGASATVRAARRRRTTLLSVGDQIIEEAKRLANMELPSRNPNGGRNIGYDFAAKDRAGKTYVQSFDMRVERRGGRLVLIVFNTHDHAQDVEFGNADGAVRTVRRKHGYFAIPLSAAGVTRNRVLQASPEAKERARQRARISYARRVTDSSDETMQDFGRRFKDIKKRLDRSRTTGPLKTKAFAAAERDARQWEKDRRRTLARIAGSQERAAQARAALGKSRSSAFVKVNPATGQPSLYTKEFRTYRGYAILRQATRRVTLRTLE